uniref:Rhomboid domain containing 1 n=1 Tax=Nothoprocta perdicaria TaxID=30464 RepID=A0A8C6ZUW6_NOTPE
MQRRQRGISAGLLLLFYEISRVGFQNIPPVTLGTLALNIILFLNPLGPLSEVCISVNESFYRKNWWRLLLSPIHHADDWHLYFNMVSMLWKGIMLERKLGSAWLAYIIAVFSVLIGVVYMALEYALAELLGDPTYKMICAVGFSGVLFALKVLNNHYNPGRFSSVLGMQISNKYACWVELVAIHLVSPGTSFAGHLAGILVGLMYTVGPLKRIMKACYFVLLSTVAFHFSGISYLLEKAFPSCKYYDRPGYEYSTRRNYDVYTGGLTEEEQLERAVLNSLNERGRNHMLGRVGRCFDARPLLLYASKLCSLHRSCRNLKSKNMF